jgi:glycine/D-amino acid oxidase-like deaminating enzyme/nitrite reductase/ring-hydroxylating ferredoxin subunit
MDDKQQPNASVTSGANVSWWIESQSSNRSDGTVQQNIVTETLVVGGGIAGLTTAYFLLRAGKKVVLVEDGLLGSGESGRTTAHLASSLDDRYYELEKFHGKEGAALAAASHTSAIKAIENILYLEKIECQFTTLDGYLFLHPSDTAENLRKEYDATKRAGLDTAMLASIPGLKNLGAQPCIRFAGQAQFHIMEYLHGLADAVERMGGIIYTNSKAENITSKGAKVNGFEINADHIVVATNTPINDLVTMHTKQWPYRTYVVAGKIKKRKLPYALWWDTGDQNSKWISMPYHYCRLTPFDEQYDLLIVGGEDHKTGQADAENIPEEQRYEKLEAWTRHHFPDMEEVAYKWSGQVLEPVDSLGFMGRNPGDDNIYIITGDSGNGMTHTTIGAMLVTDLIMGRANPYEKLYDPSRISLRATGDFLTEAGNMAKQYLDWITPEDLKDADNLAAGEGGIIVTGMHKTAVYRDENNALHAFTAVCPHMGCIVQWNADEKSFDCPCHGSRFTCNGEVTNGPAITNLKPVTIKNS